MKEILQRRSIRKYLDKPVSDKDLDELLRCAMAAPSANNQQSWEFIIVKERDILNNIAKVHPDSYHMLEHAPAAIVVCGNLQKEIYKEKGFWVQDCSAATENILIKAQNLGLGAVWCGI
ncbi:MAG: nitroreductase family protein [Actinobacteria bacterium]|nr:nitroreductase family protein [Actinomycetota bacterium]